MKKYSKGVFVAKHIVFGLVAGVAFTFAVMLLWNWLMPLLFGITVITFWQALGVLALSKILFGSGGHRSSHSWHNKEKSKLHHEQFKSHFSKMKSMHHHHEELKSEE